MGSGPQTVKLDYDFTCFNINTNTKKDLVFLEFFKLKLGPGK